ncbi:serine protease [Gigaspora margarita]|uniref:Serine protease n=1 Tax=Gigaspora margarita TaxID=4874 RepID=A0A8H4AYP1_GIGMA|nr:serine protease [Gigaspora margarita]
MKISSKKIIPLFILSLLGSGSGEKSVSETQTQSAISYPMRINLGEKSQPINKRAPDESDLVFFAGYPISFENQKNCTAAFIANKQGIGFITSAQCCVKNNCNFFPNQSTDNVYAIEDDGNVTLIGAVYDMMFGNNGLDYVFVTSILIDWDNIPYTTGLTSDNDTISELYPITSYLTLNETGHKVCAYGAKNGYICGLLQAINVEITVPNPWNEKVLSAGIIELTTSQQDNATDVTEVKTLEWNDTLNIMDSKNKVGRPYYIYAGSRIYVQISNTQNSFSCTAGFPVIKPNGIKGILTAGHCVYKNNDPDVYTMVDGKLEDIGDATKVAVGDRDGNEYAFIELHTWIWGDPTACAVKPDRNGILQFVPITSLYTPKLGERVCGFGSFNGYICGKIVAVDVTAEFARSEGLPNYVAKSLYKVDTGKKGFGEGDSGGPIFTSEGLVRAHAVGHIVGGDKYNGRNILYYMPIKKTLKALGDYKIIMADSCSKI